MNNSNTRLFSKRIFILLIAKIFLLFILIGRLLFLQVKENFYFNRLSEKNRTNLIPIIPKRGLILDNFNMILADNVFLWEVLFIKSNINQGIDLFINTISSIISLSDKEKEKIYRDYKSNPAYYPILIKQNISQSEIAAIETFSYNLPGVFIRPFYRRNYSLKESAFHLIGYTSEAEDKDQNNGIAGWYVGRTALELSLDSFLKGELGYSKYEINAKGEAIRKLNQIPSKQGYAVYLTIDSILQEKVYSLLSKYNSASVVVNDINTGDILALASYPAIDPNLFSQGFPSDIWKELSASELAPLSNKAISGQYPPGSTIKAMIALKALEEGLITPNTEVNCKGYIDVGKDRFHCWKRYGHGKMKVHDAIAQSCDVFFYDLARKIDPSFLYNLAYEFGGNQTHLPLLNGEQKGRLPNDEKNYRSTVGDIIVSTIGQGTWLITPNQLSYMMSLIANNGKKINFNLIKKIEYDSKIIYPKSNKNPEIMNYSSEYFDLIRKALYGVVNEKKGGGQLARTNDSEWEIAGKTGTAQVRRITLAERKTGVLSNSQLPWNKRDHALFTGFVPFNNPSYAISVVVEHGGSGGVASAQIARDIALLLKERHPYYEKEKEYLNKILNNI